MGESDRSIRQGRAHSMTSNRSEDKMSSRLNSRLASVVDAQIDANQGSLAEVHSGKDAVAVQGSGGSGEISFNTQDLNSDVFQGIIDFAADLLSWRDAKRSVGALTAITTCFYYAAFRGFGLLSLVAYSLLIRIIWVQCYKILFSGGTMFGGGPKQEEAEDKANPYALSNTIVVWQGVESLQDYGISLRVVLMLWAVAFLGRLMSDAQVVFGFSLFIFGKSVRWFKKDKILADDMADDIGVPAPPRTRRASWQDAIRMVTVHERTKKHLLKLPSKWTSMGAIFAGCYLYAMVVTPVDIAVFGLVCFLGIGTLNGMERGMVLMQIYETIKTGISSGVQLYTWLSAQAEAKDKTSITGANAVKENERGNRLHATVKAATAANASASAKSAAAAPSEGGPVPTPSVDELLKQHKLKSTLDGYQKASALRHELTQSDIRKYGHWLTPKGQKRFEPSTMPKYT